MNKDDKPKKKRIHPTYQEEIARHAWRPAMYRKTTAAYKERQRALGNPKFCRKHKVWKDTKKLGDRYVSKKKFDESELNSFIPMDEEIIIIKEKEKIKEMKEVKFTKKFMEEFFTEWFKWLKDATFIEGGNELFKGEIPRTTYDQFLRHYERLTGHDIWLSQLENEFKTNDRFISYMVEIDKRYESLLEMYATNKRIDGGVVKFMFTNKYTHWTDTKRVVNQNIIEKFVWEEKSWEDKLLLDAQEVGEDPLLLEAEYEDVKEIDSNEE